MNSKDFEDRFKAEYFQLSNRIDGLSSMLKKYREGTLTFTPRCSLKLLDGQLKSMIVYKTHLKERAKIEDINLDEPNIENLNLGKTKIGSGQDILNNLIKGDNE